MTPPTMTTIGVNQLPLVSIVMPSFNQAQFIDAAIESVLYQSWTNLELIVVDGGSTDASLSRLQFWQTNDYRIKWTSGKDNGPANAVNKAIQQARGSFIGWLNSDDLYTPGTVQRTIEIMAAHPHWIMVYGHGQHINDQGQVINDYPTLPPETPVQKFADGCFVCQPTVFFKRSMPLLLGKLDESLKTAFDFDYWLRAFHAFPGRIGFIDTVQAYSRLHHDCITQRMRRTVALEGMQVLARHFGRAPYHWLLTYVEKLLSQKPVHWGLLSVRAHVETTLDEAALWLTPKDLENVKHIISKDVRLDLATPPLPEDNATIAEH